MLAKANQCEFCGSDIGHIVKTANSDSCFHVDPGMCAGVLKSEVARLTRMDSAAQQVINARCPACEEVKRENAALRKALEDAVFQAGTCFECDARRGEEHDSACSMGDALAQKGGA